MRSLLRALVFLLLAAWVGAALFFPVVAWAAFGSLSDTHAAGTIVAKCLRTLHYGGLIAGSLIVLLLLVSQGLRAFSRTVVLPILLVLAMLGLTAYSQFSIIPRMEADRIRAGGAIDLVPKSDPNHADFDHLHQQSVSVESAIMVAGVLTWIGLAWASARRSSPERPLRLL